nr:MAG TPA: hypothetical protein [Caudoviricetes sp.]
MINLPYSTPLLNKIHHTASLPCGETNQLAIKGFPCNSAFQHLYTTIHGGIQTICISLCTSQSVISLSGCIIGGSRNSLSLRSSQLVLSGLCIPSLALVSSDMLYSILDMLVQLVINDLNLRVCFSLGVSVRHCNIQTIFLNGDAVIAFGRHTNIDRDLIVIRDSDLSSRSDHTNIDIDQSANRDLYDLASGDSQLDLVGFCVVSTSLHNQILAQIDHQLIAAKHRQLDGTGLSIIGGIMGQATHHGGNRSTVLCHTQSAGSRRVGDIRNKQTFLALGCGDFCIHIVSHGLGGGQIVIACIRIGNLSHNGTIQLYKLSTIPNVEGIVSHTDIQQALNLSACRQSAHQLAALGVLICTLENLACVCNKIQCVGIFGSQLIIIRFCTVAKIYISHLCLTFLKFLPNKICRLNVKRFNRKKPRGFALLNDPRSIFTIFVFHHNGLTCISVFRLI